MANTGKIGKPLKFKLVKADKNSIDTEFPVKKLGQIDDLIVVDVYEGYHKLGRYRLSDAKLKFK